ncbi:hypothetical protein EP10_000202 [Geobacillus icigianus]|uniref:Transposase n=1 Tax=Geobacillus icigianus TaxID=1430331 RepID=A0ABU6BBT5_9BACL|nr:hypothetical protein [Geobacillus icigianus]
MHQLLVLRKAVRQAMSLTQAKAWRIQGMERIDSKKRKGVEMVFSILLEQHEIIDIQANSVTGFEVVLDGILLAYSLAIQGMVER